MRHRLVVFGAGGHAAVTLDLVRRSGSFDEVVLSSYEFGHPTEMMGARVVDENDALTLASSPGWLAFPAVGDNAARTDLCIRLSVIGARLATLVHPDATVSASATIGDGCIVLARANVGPRASVGRGSIVNTGADVEHDCRVGEFCHLSPGALMGGGSELGDGAWMCIGSCCSDHVSFPAGSVLGAGSVFLGGGCEPGMYVGAPAKMVRRG